jgi:TonB family protein
MSLTKEQRFGIISSIIFIIGFIGILMFFGFSTPYPIPEEEGILINFGTDDNGIGNTEPKTSEKQETIKEIKTTPKPTPKTTPTPPVNKTETPKTDNTEETLTQDFDKTAIIEEKRKKEKKKKEAEIERIKQEKREQEEKERIRQEEIAKQKKIIEEEHLRKKQEINNRAKNAFGGKNPVGDNKGEGNTNSSGNQGSVDGDVNSKNREGNSSGKNGVSFNLNGRSSKSLPAPPKIHNTEGKVVVEVTVDQNGNVIKARAGVRGTTISNEALLKVAKEAAMKASFNVDKNAPAVQKGTITYYFEFE